MNGPSDAGQGGLATAPAAPERAEVGLGADQAPGSGPRLPGTGGSGRTFERFVARRYLAGGRGLISFITTIAVGGVSVGVMALIVVIGVLTGLQNDLRERILAGGPHAVVLQMANAFRMDAWPQVLEQVRSDPDVVAAAPFVYSEVVLNAGENYNEAVAVRGILDDPEASQVTGLGEHIVIGGMPFGETESGSPGIVVGQGLAETLGLYLGKQVTAASLQNAPLTPTGFSPTLRRFEVTGVFRTGLYQYDDKLAFIALPEAQRLLGLGAGVSGVEFDVRDPWEAGRVSDRIEAALDFPYKVDDWQQLNANLFSALKLEKLAMAVILTLIILVASFNIVSTLVMMVTDKTREIGILRSMGVTEDGVRRIFRQMGLFIGFVGTLLGGALGALLAWLLQRYEFITLPNDVYFVEKLPIALDPIDVSLIVLGSITISFLATIYPAKKAAELTPVDAIRHE